MNDNEYEILEEVSSKSKDGYFPKAFGKGKAIIMDATLKIKN